LFPAPLLQWAGSKTQHTLQPQPKAAIVTRSSVARWLRTIIIIIQNYAGSANDDGAFAPLPPLQIDG
jgi:hypothetical protein